MGTKVQPKHPWVISKLYLSSDNFQKWENFSDIQIMDIEGFDASFSNKEYAEQFIARMNDR
jgi:phosphoenolpyruvate carboxykinase (ATP)